MENTLRVRRAEKGGKRILSQVTVAKAVRTERNRYWRIETGENDPTPREVERLARYFRCSPSILFPSLAPTTTSTADGASA